MEARPSLRKHWREITGVFLKLGAMSYGGLAIMGIMQAEVQLRFRQLRKMGDAVCCDG